MPIRHLVALAALIAGIVAAFSLPGLVAVRHLVFAAAVLAVCAAHGWRSLRALALALAFAGAGAALEEEYRLAQLNEPAPAGPMRERTMELEVEETVAERPGRCSFRSTAFGVPVTVVAKLPSGVEPPQAGERWRCRGWLSPPPPGRSRFSAHRLWVTEAGEAQRVAPARGMASRRAALRSDLERRVAIGLGSRQELISVQRAILLGSRSSLPDRLRRTFIDAGTVHVFAISGLHVMVVAGLCMALLKMLGVRQDRIGWAAIPLTAAYAALTGARPSAVRAAIMAGVYFMAPLFGRRRDLLASWAITAIVVYAARPHLVFDVGATFSFSVMLGIVLWLKLAGRLAEARGEPENPRSAEDEGGRWWRRPVAWLRRRAAAMPHVAVSAAAVSLAAWAAGVPVSASVFGRFTPGGLVANLFAIPLATATVTSGMAGLAVSYVCEPLAAPFNFISGLATTGMIEISKLVARIPCSSMKVAFWDVGMSFAWYLGWISAGALLWFSASRSCRGGAWMKDLPRRDSAAGTGLEIAPDP